jgi:hypothetical protein
MGLLSNIKSSVGKLGAKVSSIANRYLPKSVVKAGTTGIKVGAKVVKSPLGKIAGRTAGGLGLALTAYDVGKYLTGKKTKKEKSEVKKATGLLATGAKIAGGAAVLATGLYVGEQIAEKLGVRGGAGFVGSKPKKKKKKKKKGKGYKPSRGRKPKFGTKAWMSYIRGLRGKGKRRTLTYRRKYGRRGKGVSKTELRQIKSIIRRHERD